MKRRKARPGEVLVLGRQGENRARCMEFDLAPWIHCYGQGQAQLLVKRPGEDTPYPAVLLQNNGMARWVITAADVYRPGEGQAELQYCVDNVIVKSSWWPTIVLEAMEGSVGSAPEPEEGWVSRVIQAGAQAEQAAQRAENASSHPPAVGENGNWWTWDAAAGGYADTGVPAQGESVYQIGHGLKLEGDRLSVDTAQDFQGDNTLPITAAAVQAAVGNIEILLGTI